MTASTREDKSGSARSRQGLVRISAFGQSIRMSRPLFSSAGSFKRPNGPNARRNLMGIVANGHA
jgi:hypothetical protein